MAESLITLFHPFLTGVSIRVPAAAVDAWTGAGWLNNAPPEDYQDHAPVQAVETAPGVYDLRATMDDGETVTVSDHYSTTIKGKALSLAARLSIPRFRDTLSTDIPTITYTTTQGITGGKLMDIMSMTTHPAGAFNQPMGRIDGGMVPLEFYFDGSDFEMQITGGNGYSPDTDIWVDDRPISATLTNFPEHTTNVTAYYRFTWTTARRRKIRMTNFGHMLRSIRVPDEGSQVYPVTETPTVGILTDSFGGQTGYGNNYDAFPYQMEKALNVNLLRSVSGGSGYISGGQIGQYYSHEKRRATLDNSVLDALVFFGSINDPGDRTETEWRDAFRATWDAYAEDHPGTPFVVFGVQPAGGANLTNTGVHARNRAMYLESQNHPSVIGFVDMLGTALTGTVPPDWNASTVYPAGALVNRYGATYRFSGEGDATITGNYVPEGNRTHWTRVSWVFSGTGNIGGVKGDGNRDFLLGGDGVHPTAKGSYAFGRLMSGALVTVLGSSEPFTYFNV